MPSGSVSVKVFLLLCDWQACPCCSWIWDFQTPVTRRSIKKTSWGWVFYDCWLCWPETWGDPNATLQNLGKKIQHEDRWLMFPSAFSDSVAESKGTLPMNSSQHPSDKSRIDKQWSIIRTHVCLHWHVIFVMGTRRCIVVYALSMWLCLVCLLLMYASVHSFQFRLVWLWLS